MDFQGGCLRQQEDLDKVNEHFRLNEDYQDHVGDLEERLQLYKAQFMEFDENQSGDIDIMELKRMMEKLGQAKTHLELKKMISEVDQAGSGTISYPEFLHMMLGKKSSVLKLILMFEEKKKANGPPQSPLSALPR